MANVATLIVEREALRASRARGTQQVDVDGRRVVYRSDAEMAAAIAALDRDIAAASSPGPAKEVRFRTRSGY